MKTMRKPWSTKLRPEMQPSVIEAPKQQGLMLLPTPLLLAAEIQKIPAGTLINMPTLRSRLAQHHGANISCPLMCGIFFNIIAGTAEEQIATGSEPIAPYWRVIQEKGHLSEKTPAGAAVQAAHLQKEGHLIAESKGKWLVVNFAQHLQA